jgi:aspartate/glutamate racemase
MSVSSPRVALIHALIQSIEPINDEMERAWPQAMRTHLLDDSLSNDLAHSDRGLDASMHQRFERLAQYAEHCGAQAIIFTCSAFGPCIEAVSTRRPHMPVLKPNEAMVAEASAMGGRLGLIASFAPTLLSMPAEFSPDIDLQTVCVPDALAALQRGDGPTHDLIVVQAAQSLAQQGCTAIALAQFSMARAQTAVAHAVGLPVLTTPGSAVRALRQRWAAQSCGLSRPH